MATKALPRARRLLSRRQDCLVHTVKNDIAGKDSNIDRSRSLLYDKAREVLEVRRAANLTR